MVKYLIYFDGMWSTFESINAGKANGRGLDSTEFKRAAGKLGMSSRETAQEFKALATGGSSVPCPAPLRQHECPLRQRTPWPLYSALSA